MVLESNASEHAARMVAMDNGTTNAREIVRSYKLTSNGAHQAAIATQIVEISSGTEGHRPASGG